VRRASTIVGSRDQENNRSDRSSSQRRSADLSASSYPSCSGPDGLRQIGRGPGNDRERSRADKRSARPREQRRLDDFLGDVPIGRGMLDEREDSVGHEPRSADWGASAGHLGHLHHAASGVDLHSTPIAACDHFVRAHLVASVYDDLDSVTAHLRTVPRAGPTGFEVWGNSHVS
jgi:hypothetical protein